MLDLAAQPVPDTACFYIINDPTTISPSPPPGETEGCAPFFVKAINCSNGSVSYNFDYQGVFDFNASNTYLYNTPGTYRVAQFRGPNVPILEKIIRVYDSNIKPSYQWYTCGKKLHLEFNDPVFTRYAFFPRNILSDSINIPGAGLNFDPGQPKVFTFDYPSADGIPFSFSVRGNRPSTCNKDLVSETITLYASPQAPEALELEATGTDTLKYRATIGVRADEDFAFQQAPAGGSFSGQFAEDRSDNDNAGLIINLPDLNGNKLQGGELRAITYDRCGTAITPASAEWTIFWPHCETGNKQIKLTWPTQPIAGLSKFEIYRNGSLLASPSFASGTYLDAMGLICGQTYQYQFQTEVDLPGGKKLKFKSAIIGANARSNIPPPAIENFTASATSAGIVVNGKPSPLATTYHLFRKEKNEISFEPIGNGFPSLPITDSSAEIKSKAYCYRISFKDICDNESLFSDTICPVLLKAAADKDGVDFTWTSLDGWENGPQQYELIRKADGLPDAVWYSGLDLDHRQAGQDKDSKVIRFQVKVSPASGTLYPPSFSNEVEIIQETRLRCPDAFTPNNDGENETFLCYGSFIKSYELRIYNSWGNVVFSTDKILDGWDGKIDDQEAPSGNYGYRVIATDASGKRLERSGFFALIR